MFKKLNKEGKELMNKLDAFNERFSLFLKESSFGSSFYFNGMSIKFDDDSYPNSFRKTLTDTLEQYVCIWANNESFVNLLEKNDFKSALTLANMQVSSHLDYLDAHQYADDDTQYINRAIQYISDLYVQFMLEMEQVLYLREKAVIKSKQEKLLIDTLAMLKVVLETAFSNGIPKNVKLITRRVMHSCSLS